MKRYVQDCRLAVNTLPRLMLLLKLRLDDSVLQESIRVLLRWTEELVLTKLSTFLF